MIKPNLTLRGILTIAVIVPCAMMFSTVSFAQGPTMTGQGQGPTTPVGDCPRLMFQYDAAGNRIKRNFLIGCGDIQRTAPTSQNAVAQQEEARKKILAKSAEDIQVFPEPCPKILDAGMPQRVDKRKLVIDGRQWRNNNERASADCPRGNQCI